MVSTCISAIIMSGFQKNGSLLEARNIGNLARVSPIGMMATAHLCAAIPNVPVQEWH